MVAVSIIIKAFNEELNIARAIESCLAALKGIDGEVILADCLSEDRTLELACRYPINIVQLVNIRDRGCGAGAQLGYQHSRGEYVYLIDGDMVLHQGFLRSALVILQKNSAIAGVGGSVRQMNFVNEEFQIRAMRRQPHLEPGPVDRLAGGGLYRRAAIDSVGYLADRNLHSFEEFELGLRLRTKGWKLVRLSEPAVDHYDYVIGGYKLMRLRLRTGYARGSGELLRSAIGHPYFWELFRVRALLLSTFVFAWLVFLLLVPLTLPPVLALAVITIVAALPVTVMSLKRRSLRLGLFCVSSWIVNLVGTIHSLMLPRVNPFAPLESWVLRSTDITPRFDALRQRRSPYPHTA